MNRKLVAGGIIGIFVILILFIAFILISARGNISGSGGITDESNEIVSACSMTSGEATMIMKEEGYEPKDLEIKLCSRVVFKNSSQESMWPASNIHPTHGIYPEFDPQEPVKAGGEWSFIFDREGRWKYHDHLKPLISGTITVNP